MPPRRSAFLMALRSPKNSRGLCADLEMPAMALLDRDGVYGSPRFHVAATKAGIRAHIGAELFRRSVLLSAPRGNRPGYQNLCRLITRMKMRCSQRRRRDRRTRTGRMSLGPGLSDRRRTWAAHRGIPARRCRRRQAQRLNDSIDIFGHDNVYVELQRHFQSRRRSDQSAGDRTCPYVPSSLTGDQRRASCYARCARNTRCLHLPAPSPDAGNRRPSADAECRTASEIPEEMAQALPRSSGSHRQHRRTVFAAGFHVEGSRISISPISGAGEGETMTSFLRKRTEEGARDASSRTTKSTGIRSNASCG